jgi:hypothetical protein
MLLEGRITLFKWLANIIRSAEAADEGEVGNPTWSLRTHYLGNVAVLELEQQALLVPLVVQAASDGVPDPLAGNCHPSNILATLVLLHRLDVGTLQ